jgi:hypothetical protein
VQHKAIQRDRKIETGADVLSLALARGPGGMSLRDFAGGTGVLGLASLGNPAIKYRLDRAVDFLQTVTDHPLAAHSASRSLHWPWRTIRVADGTLHWQTGQQGDRLARARRIRSRRRRHLEPRTDRRQRRGIAEPSCAGGR